MPLALLLLLLPPLPWPLLVGVESTWLTVLFLLFPVEDEGLVMPPRGPRGVRGVRLLLVLLVVPFRPRGNSVMPLLSASALTSSAILR